MEKYFYTGVLLSPTTIPLPPQKRKQNEEGVSIKKTNPFLRRMLAADSQMNIDCVDPLGRFVDDGDGSCGVDDDGVGDGGI